MSRPYAKGGAWVIRKPVGAGLRRPRRVSMMADSGSGDPRSLRRQKGRTRMAYEGMIAETIRIIGHHGDPVSAYVARPLGAGPFPGIVLIHHMPGWDEWYRECTRRFAHHGYDTISHNLYERLGEGKAVDVADKAWAVGGV